MDMSGDWVFVKSFYLFLQCKNPIQVVHFTANCIYLSSDTESINF